MERPKNPFPETPDQLQNLRWCSLHVWWIFYRHVSLFFADGTSSKTPEVQQLCLGPADAGVPGVPCDWGEVGGEKAGHQTIEEHVELTPGTINRDHIPIKLQVKLWILGKTCIIKYLRLSERKFMSKLRCTF